MKQDAKTASNLLQEHWWATALRGLMGVLVGIIALFLPLPTMIALVWLFGAFAVLDGVFNLAAVWRQGGMRSWWAMVLNGVLGIGVGTISFIWPGITALALVFLIAAWAVVTGVLEMVSAVRLRKEIKSEWLLALSGILSIGLGVIFFIAPDAGVVALVWLWGAYTAASGIALIWLSLRLRARHEALKGKEEPVRAAA
jgi:uncharacterized membrane protein HdeD (DUF308 family)